MSAQVDGGPPDRGAPPPIALAGSGRQRGRIHGESLRETIHEAVDRWRRELANELGSSVDEYLNALVGETRLGTSDNLCVHTSGWTLAGLAGVG